MKYLISNGNQPYQMFPSSKRDGIFRTRLLEVDFVNTDFEIYDPVEMVPQSLPTELLEPILYNIFLSYVHNCMFAEAVSLATEFSPSFTRGLFRNIFKKSPAYRLGDHVEITRKISNLFLIIHTIHQSVLSQENVADCTYYSINFRFSNPYNYHPWDLVDETRPEKEKYMALRTKNIAPPSTFSLDLENDWLAFKCGPSLGDIVWLEGGYDQHGMFDAKREMVPVVVLQIHHGEGSSGCTGAIMNRKVFNDDYGWIGFNKLIRLAFGYHTGLFYITPAEGNLFSNLTEHETQDMYITEAG
jgi:hypothetical protein